MEMGEEGGPGGAGAGLSVPALLVASGAPVLPSAATAMTVAAAVSCSTALFTCFQLKLMLFIGMVGLGRAGTFLLVRLFLGKRNDIVFVCAVTLSE